MRLVPYGNCIILKTTKTWIALETFFLQCKASENCIYAFLINIFRFMKAWKFDIGNWEGDPNGGYKMYVYGRPQRGMHIR
jgi:hypothetical protein